MPPTIIDRTDMAKGIDETAVIGVCKLAAAALLVVAAGALLLVAADAFGLAVDKKARVGEG